VRKMEQLEDVNWNSYWWSFISTAH